MSKNTKKGVLSFSYLKIPSLVALVFSLTLFNFFLFVSENKRAYVLGAQSTYEDLILYWQSFLEENPDYIAGWIRLSQLEFEKGDIIAAQNSFWKAYAINPNSHELESLKLKLGL